MRTLWIVMGLLLAAGVTFWQAESRAALTQRLLLRDLAARLEPYGTLSYRDASAHFWGSGAIAALRFEPTPALAGQLGLPAGAALTVTGLRYTDWQGDGRWPRRLRLQGEAVSLPLPAPWPSPVESRVDWDYSADTGLLRLDFTLTAPGTARLEGQWNLRLPTPPAFEPAVLMGSALHYQDLGLAQEARARLAQQLGADPANAEQALAQELSNWLSRQGIPPDDAMQTALSAFAREPTALTAQFDPPGSLRPSTLPQFAPADRAAALGLRLSVP